MKYGNRNYRIFKPRDYIDYVDSATRKKSIIKSFNACTIEYGWESCDNPAKLHIGFVNESKSLIVYFSYKAVMKAGLRKKWEEWQINHRRYPLLKSIRK